MNTPFLKFPEVVVNILGVEHRAAFTGYNHAHIENDHPRAAVGSAEHPHAVSINGVEYYLSVHIFADGDDAPKFGPTPRSPEGDWRGIGVYGTRANAFMTEPTESAAKKFRNAACEAVNSLENLREIRNLAEMVRLNNEQHWIERKIREKQAEINALRIREGDLRDGVDEILRSSNPETCRAFSDMTKAALQS